MHVGPWPPPTTWWLCGTGIFSMKSLLCVKNRWKRTPKTDTKIIFKKTQVANCVWFTGSFFSTKSPIVLGPSFSPSLKKINFEFVCIDNLPVCSTLVPFLADDLPPQRYDSSTILAVLTSKLLSFLYCFDLPPFQITKQCIRRLMLHEHHGVRLLQEAQINVPPFGVARSAQEAYERAKEIGEILIS